MAYTESYRRILNRMGYYAYQSGMIYNHLRQEGAWDSHLEKSRNFILKAAERCRPRVVTVLGSGWLLDLPLAEIMEYAERINLVDVIHPPEVAEQAGVIDRVRLVNADITGGLIEVVWQKSRKYGFLKKLHSLESFQVPLFQPDFEPGFVISLNILTQLESLLLKYLAARSDVRDEEINLFRRRVQTRHLEFLMKYNSVIITDVAEVIVRNSGETETCSTLAAELPAGKMMEEWTWDFDICGTENYNSRRYHRIVAMAL